MNDKTHWLDQPKNIKLILRILYVICGLLFILDFIYHRHTLHSWEGFYGFYAIYGFVGCVLLVGIAKEMRRVVMRGEDYYEKNQGDQ